MKASDGSKLHVLYSSSPRLLSVHSGAHTTILPGTKRPQRKAPPGGVSPRPPVDTAGCRGRVS